MRHAAPYSARRPPGPLTPWPPAPRPQQECSMSPVGKHVARHARPSAPGRRRLPSRPGVTGPSPSLPAAPPPARLRSFPLGCQAPASWGERLPALPAFLSGLCRQTLGGTGALPAPHASCPHGTPHSAGHAITEPSAPGAAAGWTAGFGPGPTPGTPARGGGTPGQGDYHRRKKPVSGPGAGAARH